MSPRQAVLFVIAVGLVAPGPLVAQSARPSCVTVIRQVNRQVTENRGQPARPRVVARMLGTDPAWVRRCMAAYGRVPAGRSVISDEDREALEFALEEGRPIDLGEDSDELRYDRRRELINERRAQRARRRLFAQDKERERRQRAFDAGSDTFIEMHDN